MANKRMFSLQIVDSDAFLDMPQSAQLFYYHLCMRADDEGFVGNPKKIMRIVGIQEDDFKILLAKRFIILFKSGVVVIKHWLIHNTIRMDRFAPTTYYTEKNLLIIKENKAYTELATSGVPIGNQLVPQVKLSKVKLSKTTTTSPSAPQPFSLEEELQKWEKGPVRRMDILAWFIREKSLLPDSKEKLKDIVDRHIRDARKLEKYNDTELLEAHKSAKKFDEWTLSTILKYITK